MALYVGRDSALSGFWGNEEAKQTLIALTNDGRLRHALLLVGEAGCGKRTFARLAAAALLCEGKNRPCGVCRHCRKVLAGVHPDVVLLDCADTEAGGHRMETLRGTVLDTLAVAPNEAARRVYILANVENLSYGTPNALLKSLEEPPEHVAFILTAAARALLLDTLLSRVIPIRLQTLPPAVLRHALRERCPDADPETLERAAAMSFGSLGAAIAAVEDPKRGALYTRALEAAGALAEGAEYRLLVQLSGLEKDKPGLRTLLLLLLSATRQALADKLAGRSASPLADRLSVRALLRCLEVYAAAVDALDGNAGRSLLSVWLAEQLMEARALL